MADTKAVIKQAYSAFNKRDIDGALTLRRVAGLSERKRSAPIGFDNGTSLIPMSNR